MEELATALVEAIEKEFEVFERPVRLHKGILKSVILSTLISFWLTRGDNS